MNEPTPSLPDLLGLHGSHHPRAQQDDAGLLKAYVRQRSQAAFAALVQRHIHFVYSIALRQVRDHHLAEDVSQAVFIILAQKAGTMTEHIPLPAWLFRVTRYASAHALSSKARRQFHEQVAGIAVAAAGATAPPENDPSEWDQVAPLLDGAVAALSETDRRAVLLRFYTGRNLRDVGMTLGVSEGTAQKRVERALEKLRSILRRKGITAAGAGLAALMASNAVQAAPVGLATSTMTTIAAAGQGTIAGSAAAALAKGASAMMTWIKVKLAAVVIGAGVLTGGAGAVVIQQTLAAPSQPSAGTSLPYLAARPTTPLPQPPSSITGARTANDLPAARTSASRATQPAAAEETYDANAPWGEAVDGLQARLQAVKADWPAGEIPRLLADLRNEDGDQFREFFNGQRNCQLEVDGQWYQWNPQFRGGNGIQRSHNVIQTRQLVTVGPIWQELPPEELDRARPNAGAPAAAARYLKLLPGRHTVRVAFIVRRSQTDPANQVRVISTAAEINVLDTAGGEQSTWPAPAALTQALVDVFAANRAAGTALRAGVAQAAGPIGALMQQAQVVAERSTGTPMEGAAKELVAAAQSLREVQGAGQVPAAAAAVGREIDRLVGILAGEILPSPAQDLLEQVVRSLALNQTMRVVWTQEEGPGGAFDDTPPPAGLRFNIENTAVVDGARSRWESKQVQFQGTGTEPHGMSEEVAVFDGTDYRAETTWSLPGPVKRHGYLAGAYHNPTPQIIRRAVFGISVPLESFEYLTDWTFTRQPGSEPNTFILTATDQRGVVDRLTVDSARGWMVKHVEEGTSSGKVFYSMEIELKKYDSGRWFPAQVTRTDQGLDGTARVTSKVTIKSVDFAPHIDESLFKLKFTPGARISDEAGNDFVAGSEQDPTLRPRR